MKAMHVKKNLYLMLINFTLSLFSNNLFAQSKNEIINGSYFVAFGRFANKGELTYWQNNLGGRSIQQMVSLHLDFIKSNKSEREQTVKRSYMDAFGWQPSSNELSYWSGQNKTYGQMMTNHINNWLNIYPDKKEHVIRQSNYKVFGRNATAAEVKYWMRQATYSFIQLVATHTTCKLNNQTSSGVTGVKSNINTNGISTTSLSPQAIAGVVAAGGGNVIAPGGGNVVAAGGGNAVAAGGLN